MLCGRICGDGQGFVPAALHDVVGADCMTKDQVDIANKVVFIKDSKTPTGISEIPLTDIALEAFQDQLKLAGPEIWLFPSSRKATEHQVNFKKTWERTLRRAGVPRFRLYDLRST